MPRHIVLLRGVNLGNRNRIAMPALRAALEDAGFGDVLTYVASGNVVLSSRASPESIAKQVNALISKRFGFDVVVVVRSHAELAEVVRRNPLAKIAVDPKRLLVTFFASNVPGELVERLREVAAAEEQMAVVGREIYSYHPAGFSRSPLWERIAAKPTGLAPTSRNWSTVTALLDMSGGANDR